MHPKTIQLKQEELELKTYLRRHRFCSAGVHKCQPSPTAALRATATESEVTLWGHVRDSQLGVEFIHQYPILGFVVDFYCPEKLVVVEVDGVYHDFRRRRDRQRDGILASFAIKTLRIKNEAIEEDIERVLSRIRAFVDSR